MIRKALFWPVLCMPALLLGQAPGGVSSGLAVWYKANITSSVIGYPGAVSAWNTSGGSATGFNLAQATAARRPGYLAGNVNYTQYNYNPRVHFMSANSTSLENTGTSPNLYGTAGSIFLVTNQKPLATDGSGLTYSSSSSQRIQIKPSFRIQTSTGTLGYTADFPSPTEYGNTEASLLYVSGLGASAAQRLNSVPIACNNCGLALYNPYVANGLYVGRNGTGGEYVDCDMGEVIFYSAALTTAQLNQVESYLAIKYGITRGGNTGTSTTYNYVNSAGAAVWNKTTNAGYNNDIAGIGRDDASGLVQKQSISVNNNEPVSIGLISIDASNAANANNFATDKSFLLWGNDGGANTTVYNDPICFASLPAGIQARIKRRWKCQVTAFTQQATVGFESAMLANYLPLSNLRLLVDDDGGDWTNATVYAGAVMDGSRIEFAGVTFSAAKPFFTLATANYVSTPLPVELLRFDASACGSSVCLAWSTASERDNDRFEVERSADALDFPPIGSVPGAGNSTMYRNYGYIDRSPLQGTGYYRLRQVDANGDFTFSEVRPVTFYQNDPPVLFPNPVHDELRILGYDAVRQGPVELYNMLGERVPLEGPASGVFGIGHLPSGLYTAVIGGRMVRFVKE